MTQFNHLEFTINHEIIEKNSQQVDRDLIKDTFFVIPLNDGEAKRACEILAALKAPHVRISKQKWGATLDKEMELSDWAIPSQVKRVLIFEMPGKLAKADEESAENKIRNSGFDLEIIDHHHYWWVDRYHRKSSLEQLCEYVNWPLSSIDLAIATNDRSYIPGLKKLGLSRDEIIGVRTYDYLAQGYKLQNIDKNLKLAHEVIDHLERKGDLWILKGQKVDRSFIVQELALRTEDGVANIFEIKPRALRFTGNPKVVDRFLNLDFCNFGFQKGYLCYGGGDKTLSKFWGFRPKYSHENITQTFIDEMIKQIGYEIKL